MTQERVGQVRGAPDPLDAALGRGGDLLEGVAGQVGQLHPLEVGPQRLDGVEVGRVAGQPFGDQPVALAAKPGTHDLAAVGREAVPQQGRLLPAQEDPQLVQGLDERVGVVGVGLVVEGQRRAAAARPVAQAGRHRGPLPLEVVAEDGGVAARRPGPADDRQQRHARLVEAHDGGPAAPGVGPDPRASPRPPSARSPARRVRPRGGRGAADGTACGGAAASRRGRGGRRPRSAARSRW